jgi:hypothetical protein
MEDAEHHITHKFTRKRKTEATHELISKGQERNTILHESAADTLGTNNRPISLY